ncbi:unnamed protein product [Trichogramma brassicae]|uniref:Uncharacterized protein n=1 Tax=Trichogramma brassicae TaxID=86971 RepID=A0A6H5J5Q4_9HYME|nr:unnamed protein product [Trichogramma brassicae]
MPPRASLLSNPSSLAVAALGFPRGCHYCLYVFIYEVGIYCPGELKRDSPRCAAAACRGCTARTGVCFFFHNYGIRDIIFIYLTLPHMCHLASISLYYSKCCARTSSSVGGGGHTQPSDVRRNSLAITESAKDLVCCCIIRVLRTRYIDIATRVYATAVEENEPDRTGRRAIQLSEKPMNRSIALTLSLCQARERLINASRMPSWRRRSATPVAVLQSASTRERERETKEQTYKKEKKIIDPWRPPPPPPPRRVPRANFRTVGSRAYATCALQGASKATT